MVMSVGHNCIEQSKLFCFLPRLSSYIFIYPRLMMFTIRNNWKLSKKNMFSVIISLSIMYMFNYTFKENINVVIVFDS